MERVYSFRSVFSKFLNGVRTQLAGTLRATSTDFLIFFFGVGIMYGFRRGDVGRLRGVVIGSLVCAILGMALIGAPVELNAPEVFGSNLLVLFLPLVAVYGVAFFYLMLDRI